MNKPLDLHLDEALLRIGLIGTSLIVFNAAFNLWNQGFAFRYPINLGLSLVAWILGITCFGAALISHLPRRAAWLVLLGLIAVLLAEGYLTAFNYNPLFSPHTDNEMVARFATEALEKGQNPYRWNFTDMLRVYRDPGHFTPFLDSSAQNRVTYPALPTLILWVFDQFKLGQVRIISALAHLALMILLFVKAPKWAKPVILLPLFVFRDYLPYTFNGVQDIIWSLALVGVIYVWNRPILRALLYGMACAFRQQPWFAAPFLVIYFWHEGGPYRERLRRIATFTSLSVLVFIAVNLPFIVWDPTAWLRGAVEPSYAAFNYMSQSLGALTQYGIAAFPRLFYSALQLSSLLIMVIFYGVYARHIGLAFWIFPALFFWVYYRGLANYWMYWLPVLLAALAYNLDGRLTLPDDPAGPPRTRRLIPLALVGMIVLADGGLAVYYLQQSQPVSLIYTPPVEVLFGWQTNRMSLTVTNHSAKTFAPRFAVQAESSIQAWPWHIDSGPEQLAPGQTGSYVISAQESSFRAFTSNQGALVVVSDAGGDYTPQTMLRIPKQTSSDQPDQIANPDYRYWLQDSLAPQGWALNPEPGSLAVLSSVIENGHQVLKLRVESNPHATTLPIVRVQQTVSFPNRFAIWVYPIAAPTHPNDNLYGLEITDGDHTLRILFGMPADSVNQTADPYTLVIPAPLNQWSRQMIDLASLYDSLGWLVPLPSMRYANGLRYAVPQIQISLFAASRSVTTLTFGPFEEETGGYSTTSLLASALEHPDRYYVTIGDEQRSQRDFDLAQASYRKSLTENPANSAAYFGLGESLFGLEKWDDALSAYHTALANHYPIPGLAYKGIGWVQYNLVHYQEGLTAFEEAITLLTVRSGSDNQAWLADAYSGVGWSWLHLADCSQAAVAFEQALNLDPSHPTARAGLQKCQAD